MYYLIWLVSVLSTTLGNSNGINSEDNKHSSYLSAGIIVYNSEWTSPVFISSSLFNNILIILNGYGIMPELYDAIGYSNTLTVKSIFIEPLNELVNHNLS